MLLTVVLLCLSFSALADGYIVKLKDGDVPMELTALLTEINSRHRIYSADDVSLLEPFYEYIEYTEVNKELVLIDGEPEITLYSTPKDEFYNEQWQLEMINPRFVWDLKTYGNEIGVAVIDTGCNAHNDINLAGGYNFILKNDDYTDNHGHGTHVSGIIAAQHNENGIAGVAPKVKIYALKCVDPSYSSGTAELIAAIYDAVDKYNCRVINMSLGVLGDNDALHEAVRYAAGKGTIIVAAAGNDGAKENLKSRLWYPAAYEEVVGVGSVSKNKTRSSFSQQNDSVFVVASGEVYKSLSGTNNYSVKSGTSQASPVVAGAAALLFSADSNMTVDEFKGYIKKCSEPLTDEFCGYGLLNVEAMFKECIKDTYYVSPINSDGVAVYNCTDELLEATGIFTSYLKQKYFSGSINKIKLLPDEKTEIETVTPHQETLKFFLWETMGNLKPLTEKRISENMQ